MLSLTIITETPLSQIPQAKDVNDSENESLITTMTQPPPDTPHPTVELTIDKFPTLHTKTPSTHSIKNIEDTEFSDDLMEQSPAITSKQPIQTASKRSVPTYLYNSVTLISCERVGGGVTLAVWGSLQTLETTSDNEVHSTTNTLTKDHRNAVIQVRWELHKYDFWDVGNLQNINMDKKRRTISKATYIEVGDYLPSNEYTINYTDNKTIRIYRKLTENRIDIETLYQQIHNQLNKQDKL